MGNTRPTHDLYPSTRMDDPERKEFYSPPEQPHDDEELELEPPDESIEERQRQIALATVRSSIDIDEIYREAEHNRGSEILENWVRNFRFRFQVKHLLIATAVLAIALTLIRLKLFWTTLVVSVMLSVAGLYVYLQWEERKQQAAADRRREALYARRRAQLAANATGQPAESGALPHADVPQPPNVVDELWQESAKKEAFRFQFSLRQLLMLMTVAAVVFGLVHLVGSPATAASVLGLAALAGLIVFACGYEPPQNIVFGWWLIIAMYVLVSIFTAVWSALA
jgi:hypothetical protein